jgi:hypothetical protein
MFFYLFLLFFSFVNSLILPSYGSIYSKTLQFPLLGKQNIQTEFCSDNIININLSGIVKANGSAKYKIQNTDIDIELSDNLNNLVKKKKTDFKLLKYDSNEDAVYIQLHIKPVFFKKVVILERDS